MDGDKREIKKHTNFTAEEIGLYLDKFREFVKNDKYSISINKNRKANMKFIEDYKINTNKEKKVLLGIQYDDFCYAVDNDNEDFAHETLYIFCKQQELDYWGTLEKVDIYIKINMTQLKSGNDYAYVVSFHKRNKPIRYLFK